MFNKVLIANRGEIALRVIRACKELGIKTVAVYSTADRNSLHVTYADEAICIGPPETTESYLKHSNIISVAEMKDADAIHPGVGFLAENALFAEECEGSWITFIGPSVENIALMGDKVKARDTMAKAGLKLIPGSRSRRRKRGVVQTEEEAKKIAHDVGYPVMVKAVAGGGGRGIRIAHNDISLINVFQTAKAEAEAAFGNPDVYIEKMIQNARHIEVQILADKYGNVIHLGERECSIQRQQQKLLEEAPSAAISDELRENICKDAVKAAKSIKYSNAGTIEFLVDNEDNYYFLEVNTRVQVEHPVTEMITGIDIIKEQIRLAAGEKLGIEQKAVTCYGHAIECRINAEDAENGFTPSPGMIRLYHPPGGPGIRVDSHAYNKYIVPPYYDSLVAKLIAHAPNRDEAIARMRRALDEFVIEGIKTTIPFHQKVMEDERFLNCQVYTHFLDSFEG
ncbi:MAG: acetyl-CoA carboxylase biotin carboxylase subunit [Candidatus Poribacteria bacterium]